MFNPGPMPLKVNVAASIVIFNTASGIGGRDQQPVVEFAVHAALYLFFLSVEHHALGGQGASSSVQIPALAEQSPLRIEQRHQ